MHGWTVAVTLDIGCKALDGRRQCGLSDLATKCGPVSEAVELFQEVIGKLRINEVHKSVAQTRAALEVVGHVHEVETASKAIMIEPRDHETRPSRSSGKLFKMTVVMSSASSSSSLSSSLHGRDEPDAVDADARDTCCCMSPLHMTEGRPDQPLFQTPAESNFCTGLVQAPGGSSGGIFPWAARSQASRTARHVFSAARQACSAASVASIDL